MAINTRIGYQGEVMRSMLFAILKSNVTAFLPVLVLSGSALSHGEKLIKSSLSLFAYEVYDPDYKILMNLTY